MRPRPAATEVHFTNGRGYRLDGVFHWPGTGPGAETTGREAEEAPLPPRRPIVIFAHGFDSGKDSPRSLPVADALGREGIASLLFDFTGHGGSEGSRWESTLTQQVDDMTHALWTALGREEIDRRRIGLHGSSSGALVILEVLLGLAAEGKNAPHAQTEALSIDDIHAAVLRAPRVDDVDPKIDRRAAEISVPTLLVQGEFDPLLAQTQRFVRLLDGNAHLVVVPGAGHLFDDPADLGLVTRLTVEWFKKKL